MCGNGSGYGQAGGLASPGGGGASCGGGGSGGAGGIVVAVEGELAGWLHQHRLSSAAPLSGTYIYTSKYILSRLGKGQCLARCSHLRECTSIVLMKCLTDLVLFRLWLQDLRHIIIHTSKYVLLC